MALGDFTWEAADKTAATVSPPFLRLIPVIFTDRATGDYYIIKHDGVSDASLAAFIPSPQDLPFAAYDGPAMTVVGTTVRLYVENASLLFEVVPYRTNDRPVIFGEVNRPLPQQNKYRLLLPESAL